uniref:Uncharacterized protein n=1 Tax=Rhizophora mucronata TaxID=61149 RepID=A0A2P2PKL4_RHIMU
MEDTSFYNLNSSNPPHTRLYFLTSERLPWMMDFLSCFAKESPAALLAFLRVR